jgi:shikimate kinase
MGAISVVNAIASGKGATVSVRLPTRASVRMKETKGRWDVMQNGRPSLSRLAKETVLRAIESSGKIPGHYSGWVETASAAPVGVGLKTSSSASVAIALATFSALGRKSVEAAEVLNCSVLSSIATKVSVTGALDDAASCLMGGTNFTDNHSRKVLSSVKLGRGFRVLIRVPDSPSRRGSVSPNYVMKFSEVAERIFGIGRKGRIWKAMTLNGVLYSSIYGYAGKPALEALEAGALGAGLSGTGPAVAAVFDSAGGADELARRWSQEGAKVIQTETTDSGATVET